MSTGALSPEFVRWAAGEDLLVTVERRRDGTRRKLLVHAPEQGPCQRPWPGEGKAPPWRCAHEDDPAVPRCAACPGSATAEEVR